MTDAAKAKIYYPIGLYLARIKSGALKELMELNDNEEVTGEEIDEFVTAINAMNALFETLPSIIIDQEHYDESIEAAKQSDILDFAFQQYLKNNFTKV